MRRMVMAGACVETEEELAAAIDKAIQWTEFD